MNPILILLGGALVGVGVYWYVMSTKECNEGVFGGATNEYECYLKNILQLGCEWNGTECISTSAG